MNLSQLAFRFRPVVLLATVAAMFFGAFSYLSLPTREDPSITVREAVVSTRFAGLPAGNPDSTGCRGGAYPVHLDAGAVTDSC